MQSDSPNMPGVAYVEKGDAPSFPQARGGQVIRCEVRYLLC